MDALVEGERLVFGDFCLESRGGRLSRKDGSGGWMSVPIGARALAVLRVLVDAAGVVVSKDAIMDAVWPGIAVESNNLTVQMAALRRVLDAGRSGESCIQTVSGRGYRLDLPVTRLAAADASPVPEPGVRPNGAIRRWHALVAGSLLIIVLLLAAGWYDGWFSRSVQPPALSLVVLPFENVGGEETDNYLVAGITDDLTTALSHIPGAFVISRATAATYRGKSEDIRKIGHDLGVRYAVRGSVQRLGQVLRVNSELSATDTGAQLWSDSFDQRIADLASVQDEIVIRMRSALNISLADIEAARSLAEHPTNPDAFDLILRARAMSLLPVTKETVAQTLALYEQALQRDPNSVLALSEAAEAVLNGLTFDMLPYDVAIDRAQQYSERARRLQPNAELVLVAQANLLDWQQGGVTYRQVRPELEAAATRLMGYYPNNFAGYFELGVLRRNQGRFDEAAGLFAQAIRLNPRAASIKNLYWNMAYCRITAGHDREGLEWANRTMSAEGSLAPQREKFLLNRRVVAYVRTGAIETAKRLAAELNDRYPLDTWRERAPNDPSSATEREQFRSIQAALRAAGNRDHLDPEADFGVPPDEVLHGGFGGKTPMTAPGVTTVSTEQLAAMLETEKPLVIDTMDSTWYRSVPGTIGLDFRANTGAPFTGAVQQRLEQKLHSLTNGDMAKPIVAMGFNVGHFDGYNLALRLRHAGYTSVYWYRGGREAWEVAGEPEEEVRPADW